MNALITWADRAGRPLLRLTLPLVLIFFAWQFLSVLLDGMRIALTTGRPVPSLTGGLEQLIVPILVPILSVGAPLMFDQWTRHRERKAEIAYNSAPRPFDPSPGWTPEPGGGLANPHNGPQDPA